MTFFAEIDGKLYATGRAHIVSDVDEMPRELAFALPQLGNPSFMWVAGRYVQANRLNKNGHYWSSEDLVAGEKSIRYTPLNTLHDWNRPVGTFVETKIVEREQANQTPAMLPEIQALAVVWAANFPEVAALIREAHEAGNLHFSMECVSEKTQCLTCDEVFAYEAAVAGDGCEHLRVSRDAPRRFINPVFLGGALIYPPNEPAWSDADITEVARRLTDTYAHRTRHAMVLSVEQWEHMMVDVVGVPV